MALSPEEQKIVDYGKANGKSVIEVKAAVAKYRAQNMPAQPTTTPAVPATPAPGSAMSDLKQGFNDAQNAFSEGEARAQKIDGEGRGFFGDMFGKFASDARAGGEAISSITSGAVRALPGGTTVMDAVDKGASWLGEKIAPLVIPAAQKVAEATPDALKPALTDAGNLGLGVLGIGGSVGPIKPVAQAGEKVAAKVASEVAGAVSDGAKAVTQSPVVAGAIQTGIELKDRVPRFVSRQQATLRDQATKAERLATAPEPIKKAIQAGVDEPIINTIEQADAPTRAGYKEIVRLAEDSVSTTGTIKQKVRPEIVAGEAAAEQYKLIDMKRKEVGKAIGDATKELSQTTAVPMRDSYAVLDEHLADIGIQLKPSETGMELDFSRTGFTNAQRAKIKELYTLATEGGDNLTPAQIHDKDRLFSQLQREARMDGIGDILVDTPDGKMSLFSVFRDVYSGNLDSLSPEIKALNSQYRNLKTFVEDIEGSIIKTGKFETNKTVDPSEYAQTNLRRLFSEAQSAADYRAIADEMDNASRALGYTGAKPEELARFAYEIRKIYPETTPRTGLEGSMKASVGGIVESILKAGKADLSDQQKALRELLDAMDATE